MRGAWVGVPGVIALAAMLAGHLDRCGGQPTGGEVAEVTRLDQADTVAGLITLDRERIAAGEREQERIAAAASTVAGRILDLLKAMRANQAADADIIARWEEAVRELTALSQQNMARVVTVLRRARLGPVEAAPEFLRTASLEQREILSRLMTLLRQIEKRVAFARLVEQVEQLVRDQERVKDQTVAAARETLGKAPDQFTEPEREQVKDLADEQGAIRESYDGLRAEVERLAQSPAEAAAGEPTALREAAAVTRAAERMRADRPDQDMRQAAAALTAREPVVAADAQTRAWRKLLNLRDLLRQDDSARLRRADEAARELDRLIARQREVKRQTDRLPADAPAAETQEVVKAQNAVTHATSALASAAEGVAPKAAEALRQATTSQHQAESGLADGRPRAASTDQQQALDRMAEARAALGARAREAAERLAEPRPLERLENLAANVDRLAAEQAQALENARQMAEAAEKGQPASAEDLNRAAQEQRALAKRTDALERETQPRAAAEATRTLHAALAHQEAAAQHLQGQRPDQAATEQKQALDQLQQAAAGLRYQLEMAKQAQAQAEALREVLARQEAAIDALGQAGRGQRDLDALLEKERALRAATADLADRMAPPPERQPLPAETASRVARTLATEQRGLEDETERLGEALGELDRETAEALAEAGRRERGAAEHLDRTAPRPATDEQDRAIEALGAARRHLDKKLNDIVALLKTLEAKRRELAEAGGEAEPQEPSHPGQGEVSVDDLLKLAGALVDIDRLRRKQDETKQETLQEAARTTGSPAQAPRPETATRLARQQNEHAEQAEALGRRMAGWDPERALGVENVRAAVRAADLDMRRAESSLKDRQFQAGVTNQTEALRDLDLAMAATVQAFQRAAEKAQQQVQAQAQQTTADPSEYDPMGRPPGALGPKDLPLVRRWNVNLPPRVRAEILAILNDRFPAGFEVLLERYYQDLSQEAWERLDLRRTEK